MSRFVLKRLSLDVAQAKVLVFAAWQLPIMARRINGRIP